MRMKATIAILLAAILPAAALAVATAVTEFTAALPGTDAATEPHLAGTVVEDRIIPYSTPAGWEAHSRGTVQVRTVRGADGRLTFYWRIVADPRSRDRIHGLDLIGFPRTVYDANWRRDGLGTIAPDRVGGWDRGEGWVMWFDFSWPGGIEAGQESRFFFLRSSARATRPAWIRVRFGNTWSAYLPAVAPAS